MKKIIKHITGILLYTATLFLVTNLFNTLAINTNSYYLWYFVSGILFYLLQKILKPIIFRLTMPILALTYFLAYPLINVLFLYIINYILIDNVLITIIDINSYFALYLIGLLISIIHYILDSFFMKGKLND